MRLIYRFYSVAALCIAASAAAWGNVRLHSTIGNHMVIQQNSVFDIHGKADPGGKREGEMLLGKRHHVGEGRGRQPVVSAGECA